jgi:hypothetical protein
VDLLTHLTIGPQEKDVLSLDRANAALTAADGLPGESALASTLATLHSDVDLRKLDRRARDAVTLALLRNETNNWETLETASLDPQTPIDLRISCIERLVDAKQGSQALADQAEAIMKENHSLPLQEALLPLLASTTGLQEHHMTALGKFGEYEQPESSRVAAAKALAAYAPRWQSLRAGEAVEYLKLLLRLLQDDDVDVRAATADAAARALQIEPVSADAALLLVWEELLQRAELDQLVVAYLLTSSKLCLVDLTI